MIIFLELFAVLLLLISFFGLGKGLESILKVGVVDFKYNFLIGSAAFSFIFSLLSPFFSIQYVTFILVMMGFSIFVYELLLRRLRLHWDRSFPLWVLLYLIFSFCICFYPSSYFDPLNYHLYGIVEWTKLDNLVHIKPAIQLMHNSYADYLYFPFALIFGTDDVEKLVSLQVSSQLLTFFLGIFTFSLIFYDFFSKKIDKIWIALFILAAITRASLQHKGLMAKNDWIALSWFFAGLGLAFKKEDQGARPITLAAFLLGISVGAKFSYIIPALLVFIVFFSTFKINNKKMVILTVFSFFIALTPYFVRNYIWTKNPVFPLGTNFFSTEFLGPSWIEGIKFFDVRLNTFSWELILNKLRRILTYEPVVFFFLMFPFFIKKMEIKMKLIIVGLVLFIIFFILGLGPNSEIRHFGPFAIAINLIGVYGLMITCEKINLNIVFQKTVVVSFILMIFVNFLTLDKQLNPVPSAVRRGYLFPRTQTLIDERRGLLLSEKMLNIVTAGQKIGLIDDTPPYYFSIYNTIRLWDDPDLDSSLDKCKEMVCILRVLEDWNIYYLVESGTLFDPYYRPGVLDAFLRFKRSNPGIIVVEINGETLISVEKLRKVINEKI
jgi:hypothetical protein